ncbi:MAG: hypothetical protein ACOY0R_19165 [Chloroflexota bacterium]
MQEPVPAQPDASRISVLTAAVLLVFSLTRILPAPEYTVSLQLPGFYLAIPLTLNLGLTLLATLLTASGMDWVLRSHPGLRGRSSVEHWLLPTLTTLVVGATLTLVPDLAAWWMGMFISALLLLLVFLAEYIVVGPADSRYALARAGLTALAYALFLILAVFLRLAGARLFVLAPALFVGAGLIALRILYLDGANRWDFPWASGIGLVCAQLGAGLHYWPMTSLQMALALTGALYALTTLSVNVADGLPPRRASVGPLLILAVTWTASAFLR